MTATIVRLLPVEIKQMTFASLDGLPILYSVTRSYALTATPSGKEWALADQSVAGKATVLDERQFFMSFGSDLPPLPEPMQRFDHRLWLVDRGGLTFSRFLRKAKPPQGSTADPCPTADQVHVLFPERKAKRAADKRNSSARKTRKAKRKDADSEFYLGRHQYSAGPGFSWSTEYRIRRQDDDGEMWEILSVDENDAHNDDGLRFTSMGNFTTDEAKEYFDSVRFTISDEKWKQMGCRNLHGPEEQDCAICGEPFEGDLSTVHKCERGEFIEGA